MKKLNVVPMFDRIIVEPEKANAQTKSGLYIPDTAKEKPQKGTVVAVGTNLDGKPLNLQVGDTVMYGKYGGTEFPYEGVEYLIMREQDVFCKLPKEDIEGVTFKGENPDQLELDISAE